MSGHTRDSYEEGREIPSHHHVDGQSRGRIQNTKAARVYVFGDGDIVEHDSNDTAEMEMPEIRARRGQNGSAVPSHHPVENEELFFEKEIGDGETLQSLSLKYACPASELKRINNLIQDQDFFALRVLRIPMRRHGYLSETVKQDLQDAPKHKPHRSFRESLTSDSDIPPDAACSDVDFSDPETQFRIMRTVSIQENISQQGREANRFLKKMDKDLKKLRQSTTTERESLDEVVSLLTSKTIQPLKKESVNGADCGASWWMIVAIALTVAVVVPLTYFVYVEYFMN